MMVRQVILFMVCACAAFIGASQNALAADPDTPQAGLMWNRTGLPAVFPLHIKTVSGQDYYLTLTDVETDEAALAAYIKGGAFFRVLVPPGRFRLSFAFGRDWQGEAFLFGPEPATQFFVLDDVLTFEVRNPGIKAGHSLDLTGIDRGDFVEVKIKPQMVCQTLRSDLPDGAFAIPEPPAPQTEIEVNGFEPLAELPPPGDLEPLDEEPMRADIDDLLPAFAVTSRVCGP